MKNIHFWILIFGISFFSACKVAANDLEFEIDTVEYSISGGTTQYSIFWDQSDHLGELVAAKNWDAVRNLYRQERAFFDKKIDNSIVENGLKAAADSIFKRQIPAMNSAIEAVQKVNWPAEQAQWATVKSAIVQAQAELLASENEPLLNLAANSNSLREQLRAEISSLQEKIKGHAKNAFAEYDHIANNAFFQVYPISVPKRETIIASLPALTPKFEAQSPEQVSAFLKNYGDILPEEARSSVATKEFRKLLRLETRGKETTLDAVLAAYKNARRLGIQPAKLDEPRIRFVEATSRTHQPDPLEAGAD